jgi:hypothetical protein
VRTPRLGEVLLAIGAGVGVAAVIGLVVGFEPSKLPPALLNIAVYKLTFGAAAGLLAAGAVVRRYAKRHEGPDHDRTAGGLSATGPAQLGEGSADSAMRREQNARPRVDVRQDR